MNIRIGVYRRIYGQPALRKYTGSPVGFGQFPSVALAAGGITNDPPRGYRVVTTASPKNFGYLKSLGASYVFDYRDKGLVSAMAAALRDKEVMGALAISAGSSAECIDVLAHCRGRKFVANCGSPVSPESFGRSKQPMAITFLKLLPSLVQTSFRLWLKARHHKITPKFYDGSSIIDSEIGRYLFRVFLKEALAKGTYRPAPPPHVVGTHLSDIQAGFEVQKQRVSASKVVIALE